MAFQAFLSLQFNYPFSASHYESIKDKLIMNQNPLVCNMQAFEGGIDGLNVGSDMGSLVTVARTSSPPLESVTYDKTNFCKKTGEIFPIYSPRKDPRYSAFFDNSDKSSKSSRSNRWAFKAVVNKIFPKERVAQCMVLKKPLIGDALEKAKEMGQSCLHEIEMKKPLEGNAFYDGLVRCSSVWLCPLCAAKISEVRRVELKAGLSTAKEMDFKIHFITYTIPHGIGDDIVLLRKKLAKAYGKLSNGKYSLRPRFKKDHPEVEIKGFIRAVEVTHGKENGFHPHVHVVFLTSNNISHQEVEAVCSDSWRNACRLSGLPEPSERHGCIVQDGTYASKYVGKWGLEDEMTKANTKVSKSKKGVTPFGFLRHVIDADDEYYTPAHASNLFRVYAKAFKGSRQLYWSNGLKKLLKVADVSDKDAVEEKQDINTALISKITIKQWKKIRAQKLESFFLYLATYHSVGHFMNILNYVCGVAVNEFVLMDDFHPLVEDG